MAKKEDNLELNQLSEPNRKAEEFDTASKSLTEALEVSFVVLKVIMVILVIAFLASGFKTVNPDEKALVLRFGKIRGAGKDRILDSGLKWILPYPIDEMVKIPAERTYTIDIDDFWYYLSDAEKRAENPPEVKPDRPLYPTRDGYCLTRSEKHEGSDAKGNDYNLVHTKWELTYQIINPELFFTSIQIPDKKINEINQDIFREGVEPILRNLLDDVVVTAMVNYTIDEAIISKSTIRNEVKKLLQDKLDAIECGVFVKTVQLVDAKPPRQVQDAFELSMEVVQTVNAAITNAEQESTNLLNETAGPVARQLYEALNNKSITEEELKALWSDLEGTANEQLSNAEIYATDVAGKAEAIANNLKNLLPKFKINPDIIISKLYYDMLTEVLGNAQEIMTINSKPGDTNSQLWFLLNRDPSLKPKNNENSNQNKTN